jgi:dTDP-4-amino-4,6-dideoxygalactose transaminase
MNIAKTPSVIDAYVRPYRLFTNARSAFKAFLTAMNFQNSETVLLPAYIGWSAREGSGVFDPVVELALPYKFYRLDSRLRIDLEHLEHCFRTGQIKLLLIIHYFGSIDPNYNEAINLARKYGAMILEDEAHALFTDWSGGACGRLGDAGIYSLHKMLPVSTGGMLFVAPQHKKLLHDIKASEIDICSPWIYDWHAISLRRKRNAEVLVDLLLPLSDELEPLWETLQPEEIPQTFPIIVKRASRNDLYIKLNALGFGVVSLYHTLIPQISDKDFPESYRLSRSILNFPVHQDIDVPDLIEMVEQLKNILSLDTTANKTHADYPAAI